LNGLLSGTRICSVDKFGRFGVTLLVTSLVAWCLLRFRGSMSLVLAGSSIVLYGVLTAALLIGFHLVMPVALPLIGAVFVMAGTTAWTHLTAGQRMLLLERDMLRIQQEAVAVREALILRENRTEALEEDLEAANAAIAESAGQQEILAKTAESLRSEIA